MSSFVPALILAGLAAGSPPDKAIGYLKSPSVEGAGDEAPAIRPYVPHEGDLIFFDDQSVLWERLYKLGGTKPPFHVGIVVKKPDGSMAVLESGPDDTLHVYILEAERRLHTFKGVLQVREAKRALTPEQSASLTKFAVEQEGKRYAMWRLLLQGTPFKSRGRFRTKLFGATYECRSRWLCAEIVCSAENLIGFFDGKLIKGTDTYPLDIVDDHLYDLAPYFHEAATWSATP